MLGREGLLRRSFTPWRAYFRPDFHPSQQSSDLSQNWLRDNSRLYTRVASPERLPLGV
ncbi:hypothetical protein Y695_03224 [Hydrogenophaga sp. T4]|nr:hypothetical protein Y695_03224 [Hydrogenophaga sp. T4]